MVGGVELGHATLAPEARPCTGWDKRSSWAHDGVAFLGQRTTQPAGGQSSGPGRLAGGWGMTRDFHSFSPMPVDLEDGEQLGDLHGFTPARVEREESGLDSRTRARQARGQRSQGGIKRIGELGIRVWLVWYKYRAFCQAIKK